MAKSDQEAFNYLADLVANGYLIQMEKRSNGYEVSVWPTRGKKDHHHYNGASLIEAVFKIKEGKK